MIGAAIGFVFGIVAYAAAIYSDVMPFGQEITSAGMTCGILGAGVEWLIRTVRTRRERWGSKGTST